MLKSRNKFYRYLVFSIGIISTIAYRIIVVLNNYDPLLVKISWYIGTIGFVWFFINDFEIENRRDKIITDLKLVEKIKDCKDLNEKEKISLEYVLRGIKDSLNKWNYIIIFILSALALVYGLYEDFLINIF
ncbi:hypothetical protein EOL94_03405 [bacterium]|nr:hypothetical protein [bacterium]